MWGADKTCCILGKPSDFILLSVSQYLTNVFLVGLFPRAQSALDASTTLCFWTYEADDQICDHSKPTCALSQASLGSHLEF